MNDEVEHVLTNWIELALSPIGQLPADVSPARWVANKFIRWWANDFESHLEEWLGDADLYLGNIRRELERLGGWEKCGEALHECTHLADALATLHSLLPLVKNMKSPA